MRSIKPLVPAATSWMTCCFSYEVSHQCTGLGARLLPGKVIEERVLGDAVGFHVVMCEVQQPLLAGTQIFGQIAHDVAQIGEDP